MTARRTDETTAGTAKRHRRVRNTAHHPVPAPMAADMVADAKPLGLGSAALMPITNETQPMTGHMAIRMSSRQPIRLRGGAADTAKSPNGVLDDVRSFSQAELCLKRDKRAACHHRIIASISRQSGCRDDRSSFEPAWRRRQLLRHGRVADRKISISSFPRIRDRR
jgi:hypothetical protein